MARETDKALRVGRDGLDDRLVQPYPDWELNEHRAQAAQRVDAVLSIELHRLLRRALPVSLVLVLDLLHERLERAHGLDLATLLDCQRDHHQSDEQREGYDRDSEVREQIVVEQDQPVDHRLDDYEVPSV